MRTFKDLAPDKLPRYWRLMVTFNAFGIFAETVAALGLFVLLQRDERLVGPTHEPLTGSDITIITLYTLPCVLLFLYVQGYILKAIVNQHIIPYLPDAFFVGTNPRSLPRRGQGLTPTAEQCKSILQSVRGHRTYMAWSVLVAYAFWASLVVVFFGEQVPSSMIVVITAVGALVGTFYYWRLQMFDPLPLVLGTPRLGGGTEDAIRRIFADEDYRAIEELRASFGHKKNVARLQRLTTWVLRLARLLPESEDARARRKSDAPERDDGYLVKEDLLSVHHVQALAHLVTLIALIVYMAGQLGSLEIDGMPFSTRVVASVYVALAMLAAVLMDIYQVILRIFPRDPDNVAARMCAEAFGILSREDAQRESAAYVARIDETTGLPRQWCFQQELVRRVIRYCQGSKDGTALVFLDIDNFKHANSLFSHLYCNYVLWFVARCMERSVRTEDQVFRFGGEEFAIILPHINCSDAVAVARRIQDEITTCVRVVRKDGDLYLEFHGKVDGEHDDAANEPLERVVLPRHPGRRVLEELRTVKAHDLAPSNHGAYERLTTRGDETVWTFSVSVGIVDTGLLRKFVERAVRELDAAELDHPWFFDHYRQAYDELVAAASACATDAKQRQRGSIALRRRPNDKTEYSMPDDPCVDAG